MAVECTGRNVEVTPSLRNLARERAERLERHLGGPANVRVVLSHERHRFGAEIIATHRRRRWNAHEYTADPRAAVALAFEKIDAQAKKDLEKRRDRKNRASPRLLPPEEPAAPAGGAGKKGARAAAPERRIVRSGRLAVKPMSAEEAALRIESSEEEFVVFRDSGTEKISVLYRRRDGNFGLIEC
ncbi:MAG TPA: ribosome-associated translation inhibitor RaiA [Thermoanaerobaculia bacterium]|jgi:putative sigma-54 modulation protein